MLHHPIRIALIAVIIIGACLSLALYQPSSTTAEAASTAILTSSKAIVETAAAVPCSISLCPVPPEGCSGETVLVEGLSFCLPSCGTAVGTVLDAISDDYINNACMTGDDCPTMCDIFRRYKIDCACKSAITDCDVDNNGTDGDCADMTKFVNDVNDSITADRPNCAALTETEKLELIQCFLENCGGPICDEYAECVVEILGREITDTEWSDLQGWAKTGGCDDGGDPPIEETPAPPGEVFPDPGTCDILTFGMPKAEMPVDLFYGDKFESTTDLRVSVTGQDFLVSREYLSDPEFIANGLLGNKWTLSPFRWLNLVEESPSDDCCSVSGGGYAGGAPTHDGCFCENDDFPSSFDLRGPTAQRMEKATLDVGGGTTYPVWRLIDPGKWEQDYFRVWESADGGSVTDPDDYLIGLMLENRDMHGNSQRYDYIVYGADPNDEVRLNTISLNDYSGASHPEAKIRFHWYQDDTTPYNGKLKRIQVLRYDKDDALVQTQEVEYKYMDESDSLLNAALGLDGDLIQVIRSVRVDPAPNTSTAVWRKFVTQYRYHNAWANNESTDTDSDGFIEKGNANQIKMIFLPEQVEFGAQQQAEDDSGATDLEGFAEDLLALADGANAWTGQTANFVIVSHLASKVLEEYEEWNAAFPTTKPGRVKTQYIQSACGCGGGSTQGFQLKYEYFSWDSGDGHTTKVTENFKDSPWTLHRTLYYDTELKGTTPGANDYRVPYLVTKAIIDGSLEWVSHYVYDDDERTVLRMMTPSATSTYTPATASTAPVYTASTTSGLVYAYKYTDHNYRSEVRLAKGFQDTSETNLDSFADYMLVTRNTFSTTTDFEYVLTKAERIRVEDKIGATPTLLADEVEVTDFVYGYHTSGEHDFAWIKTTVEAEEVAENGPDGTYDSYELFDAKRNNYWSISADVSYTKRIFDTDDSGSVSLSGQVVQVLRNADKVDDSFPSTNIPPSLPVDRNPDGGSLLTKYVRDLLGRVQKSITPGDVETYTLREMRTFPGRSDINYYAVVTLPHEITAGSSYDGPGTISWYNGGNNVIGSSSYAIDAAHTIAGAPTTQTGYTLVITNYDLDGDEGGETGQLTRSEIVHDVSSLVTTRKSWHSLDLIGQGSGIYTTKYFYDTLGRLDYSINPEETVNRNTYDVLDRVIKVETGIASGENPSNMNDIAAYIYDGSGFTQGDGNGNLTRVRQFVNSTAGDDRDTDYTYDFRDRSIKALNPEKPHTFTVYDNLNRTIKNAIFEVLPAGNDPDDIDDSSKRAGRRRYTQTSYSQRGLTYRTRLAIDPTIAEASLTFLETHNWFDEVGRSVGTWAANGPGRKTTYDGLGRTDISYTTDRRGDADPGDPNNFTDVYTASTFSANVTGDVVFEESKYRYIDETATDHVGQMDLMTFYKRTHDADDTKTGEISGFTSPDDDLVITTYASTYFDGADRVIRSVNYGTNIDDQFKFGGTAPTITQSSPLDWDSAGGQLVTETAYDDRGLVETSTSPDGDPTTYFYDDLNRRIVVVENVLNIDAADIDWDTPNQTPDRWVIDDVGGADGDKLYQDRATSYVYDGISNVIVQTAHQPETTTLGDTDQFTWYKYGITTTSPDVSDFYSNDILRQVIYPDIEQGVSEVEADHSVYYSYNRAGELKFTEDQSGTQHTYTRDKLGRVTEDDATALGTNINGDILSIETSYYDYGLVLEVKSLNAVTSGTVMNAVKYDYNGLWQITKLHQENNGVVDGSTVFVQYDYDTNDMDTGNFSRLEKTTYPDGKGFDYEYGASDTSDEDISRLKIIDYSGLSANNIVRYDYIGLNMVAVADFEGIDVQLDRTASHGGQRQTEGNTDNPGLYPAFDRFGRVLRQTWVDGDYTVHATENDDYGNIPPIVELEYSYDKDSNRLNAYDVRPGHSQGLDHQYTYDGLDRLTDADRGTWNGSTLTTKPGSQQWALDMLGNWSTIKTDADGAGGYGTDEVDERNHDDATDANELDQRKLKEQGPSSADLDLDFTYDKAGNVRIAERQNKDAAITWTYTHDAWNRLVLVEAGGSNDDMLVNKYNGLNWRIIKQLDTPGSATGLDQQRMMYYSSRWQLIEERIDEDSSFTTDPESGDIERHVHYVWGNRYIDDCILHNEVDKNPIDGYGFGGTWYHITDVQFSTVAILDSSAALVERISYDAYGKARHHYMADWDGDGDVSSADITAIQTTANGSNHAIGEANYVVDQDINRDGDITIHFDYNIANNEGTHSGLASGLISHSTFGWPNNQVGWDGYLFNAETQQYSVRYRNYSPVQGRWLEREPIKTDTTLHLYIYADNMPLVKVDPDGQDGIFIDPPRPGEKGPHSRDKIACKAACAIPPAPMYRSICSNGRPIICVCNPLDTTKGTKARKSVLKYIKKCAEKCEPLHGPNMDCPKPAFPGDPAAFPCARNTPWKDKKCGKCCSEAGVLGCFAKCFSSFVCTRLGTLKEREACIDTKKQYKKIADDVKAGCKACKAGKPFDPSTCHAI